MITCFTNHTNKVRSYRYRFCFTKEVYTYKLYRHTHAPIPTHLLHEPQHLQNQQKIDTITQGDKEKCMNEQSSADAALNLTHGETIVCNLVKQTFLFWYHKMTGSRFHSAQTIFDKWRVLDGLCTLRFMEFFTYTNICLRQETGGRQSL